MYRVHRTNITSALFKVLTLCDIPKNYYEPVTQQNWKCELGWFSLRWSHNPGYQRFSHFAVATSITYNTKTTNITIRILQCEILYQ